MLDWDDVRYFLAVARKGSITAASRDLGVNHSTVSRRIAAFEDGMGARLFDRVSSGYALTQAGNEMLPSAQRMEEEAQALDRRLFGRDTELSGPLKVTVGGPFAGDFFMTQVDQFLAEYPNIELQLLISNDVANLHAREVDVAIRATANPPDTLVGRRLGRMVAMLYAHKNFIAPGEPGADEDSCAPPMVAYIEDMFSWGKEGWFRDVYPNAFTRCRINEPVAILQAIKKGIGIGMLPCFLGDMDPELRRLPPYRQRDIFEMWLLTHADLRKTARVRAFMNFMADAIAPHIDLIEGRRGPINAWASSAEMSTSAPGV